MSAAGAAGSVDRVARNSLLQAGADAVGKVGSILLYAVMAREAGIEAFGDFTTAASLSIVVMVAAFGMDYRITRLVARGEPDATAAFWSAIVLKLLLAVPLLIAVLAVAAAGPYRERVLLTTLLLGLAIVVELVMLTPHAVFRGREDLRPVAIALLLYRGLLAVLGIAMLLAGSSVVTVAVGWLACAVLGLGYSAVRLRSSGWHAPFAVSGQSLRTVGMDSFALGIAGILGVVLARLDIVLIGLLDSTRGVALYGAAYRLVESSQFLTTALALSSFPALARLTRTSTPSLAGATAFAVKAVLVATVPIAVVLGLAAEPVLRAVYGADFEGGARTLVLLAPVVVLAGVVGLINFVLSSQQRQRPIVASLVVGTVVNVGGNVALIPAYGAEGAAAAALATAVLMTAVLARPTLAVTGPLPLARAGLSPLAAGALALVAGTLLGGGGPGILAAVLVFTTAFALVERRFFPADLDQLTGVVVRPARRAAAGARLRRR